MNYYFCLDFYITFCKNEEQATKLKEAQVTNVTFGSCITVLTKSQFLTCQCYSVVPFITGLAFTRAGQKLGEN